MTQTILVTAATSNVGREVVKQLANENFKVKAAVRSISRAKNLPSSVELVEFDLNEPATVQAAFAGVDKAFFMTPLVPNLTELDATCLQAAKEAGIKHIVKLSVMGANTEADMLLAQSHRQAEQLIETSGINYTFLRPNSFFQNYLIYTGESIRNSNAFYLPLGDGKISLIDIRDLAKVTTVVLTTQGHENQAYQLTGSEALSNQEIAETLSNVLDKTISYVDIPEEVARQAMLDNQIPKIQIDMVLGLYAKQKEGKYSLINPTFKQLTGMESRKFEQFVQDYVTSFQ